MVKSERSCSLSSKAVNDLFLNKFVVIIGDSIQRGIYKDLIALLQHDRKLSDWDLKAKGEMTFFGDKLIEGGVKGKLNNGTGYTEVRQYQTDTHLVRFYFVTRCYNAYVESIIEDLESGPRPDLVIMNSCLWDMTRYGLSAIYEYKQNLAILFNRLSKVLPERCLMIWNTTLPISKHARGGFLVKEIEYDSNMLRLDVLEANYYARQIVREYGFDVLDLHYWFRQKLYWRTQDGIHWLPAAHRRISTILFTHVSSAWGLPFPSFQVSSVKKTTAPKVKSTVSSVRENKAQTSKSPVASVNQNKTRTSKSAILPLMDQYTVQTSKSAILPSDQYTAQFSKSTIPPFMNLYTEQTPSSMMPKTIENCVPWMDGNFNGLFDCASQGLERYHRSAPYPQVTLPEKGYFENGNDFGFYHDGIYNTSCQTQFGDSFQGFSNVSIPVVSVPEDFQWSDYSYDTIKGPQRHSGHLGYSRNYVY